MKQLIPAFLIAVVSAILIFSARLDNLDYSDQIFRTNHGSWPIAVSQNIGQQCDFIDYTFPKQALQSDAPLPIAVKESFKSTIGITVKFFVKNKINQVYSTDLMQYGGTAFMTEPGIFISARHIFFSSIIEMQNIWPFTLDTEGLPVGSNYLYEFCGTANINGKPVIFPLELIGMGDPYKFQDFAAFKASNLPAGLKPLKFEENIGLTDAAYSSGRIPAYRPGGGSLNPTKKAVLMDFINFIFTGHISAILDDMPDLRNDGLLRLYRLSKSINSPTPVYSGNVEPGFSGGPVFDKNGRVIGMTVILSPGHNFFHAISATDLKIFVQRLKDRHIISSTK